MHFSDLSAALLAFGLAAQVMAVPLPADEPVVSLEDRDVHDVDQETHVEPMAVIIEARDVWKILEVRKKPANTGGGKPKAPANTGGAKPKAPANTGGGAKPKAPANTGGANPKAPARTRRDVAARATNAPRAEIHERQIQDLEPLEARDVDVSELSADDVVEAGEAEGLDASSTDDSDEATQDVEDQRAEGLDARSAEDEEEEIAEDVYDQQAESVDEDNAGAVEEATVEEGAVSARDEVEQFQGDESEVDAVDASEAET